MFIRKMLFGVKILQAIFVTLVLIFSFSEKSLEKPLTSVSNLEYPYIYNNIYIYNIYKLNSIKDKYNSFTIKNSNNESSRKVFLRSARGYREIDRVMNAIAAKESGGDYKSTSEWSSASGAYQYIDSTWNNYEGYSRAYLAPKEVQDKRMLNELVTNYKRYGRWDKVIAHHFYPAYADDLSLWDKKIPGNPTVREYVDGILKAAGMKDRYDS